MNGIVELEVKCKRIMAMSNIVSECFIQPKHGLENSKHHLIHLTPCDLVFSHPQLYIQHGLLFAKENHHKEDDDDDGFTKLLDRLKNSLSLALLHFYPFASRVVKEVVENEDPNGDSSTSYYSLYVECNNNNNNSTSRVEAGGVKFIHATSNASVSDLISPHDVPTSLLQSFFDQEVRALDYGDPNKCLLSVMVTQLVDNGVVISFTSHHCVADGNSLWHFINTLSEIFQANYYGNTIFNISNPPIHERWFPDGHGPILNIPFSENDNIVITKAPDPPPPPPKFRVRIFHFSSHTISKLKAKANEECNTTTTTSSSNNNNNIRISSFQSLAAFVWRSITKARRLPHDENTIFVLPINTRSKLDPPLSPYYFGNSVGTAKGGARVGELLEHGLGWTALKMNQALVNYGDKDVRRQADEWLQNRWVYVENNINNELVHPGIVLINDFTKFDIFGNEFGEELGKPKALLIGSRPRMIDGSVFYYSASTTGGGKDGSSFDIAMDVSLLPHTMSNLESDQEFMQMVC